MGIKDHACYYCFHRFNASDINEWSDGGKTAHCPKCTIDAVTDGKTTGAELKALYKWWFTGKPVPQDILDEARKTAKDHE